MVIVDELHPRYKNILKVDYGRKKYIDENKIEDLRFILQVRRHFVPTTNCPTGIFWATNCPRWQNVPLSPHATNCPSDKMSHFLPGVKMYHWCTHNKPLFLWHFLGDKLSQDDKMYHFLPGDKMSQLMHWCIGKLWKVVGTFCRQWKRLLGQFVASEKGQYWAYLGGYFSVRRHYNITVYSKNIRERQVKKEINIEHIWEILH